MPLSRAVLHFFSSQMLYRYGPHELFADFGMEAFPPPGRRFLSCTVIFLSI